MTALAQSTQFLKMWVIYKYPKDFPNDFVVREWWIDKQLHPQWARFAPTLEEVRKLVPAYAHRLDPTPGDDPCIVETWI